LVKKGEIVSLPFLLPNQSAGKMKKHSITLLGLGNILMQDEGFGVHFVRWFGNKYVLPESLNVVDGGTLGYILLDTLSDSEHVIVIDVIKLSDKPGSIYRFTPNEMSVLMPPPTSAHEVKFSDVICKLEMMDECPDMTFLCIVPEKYDEMNTEMTKVMADSFPVMEEQLNKALSELGIIPEERTHA
jgi:hydrogenase maturation protease